MSLKHAVLAALLEGEASGYDLAKLFDAAVANFWSATPQQLYRELERLADEELVSARLVAQERRPTKRVFTLTESGLQALASFTGEPPRPTAVRDDLLVKIQALDCGDPAGVRELVEERAAFSRGKLARYERLRERLLDGRGEEEYLRRAERVGPYLTLLRGRAFEEENLRWCARVLAVLAEREAVRGAGRETVRGAAEPR
ncbi:PadR family transcriptional regulator [Streptomyces sp. C10-9-1]|uniref:PadR family transcriptional regulator n=1 Tax=Streptomyces sp. C10-9-1 TaxID=1859285 RepID=UPI003F4A72B8